jgi:ankyrin repeat protein
MAVPPHGYLEYNRAIPHGGDSALMFAARTGDLASARLLVAAGASVNDSDAWGVSATTLAAHAGSADVVSFLLDRGADANASAAGFPALHAAVMRRDDTMVRALLSHGADANAPLKTWTPTRRSSHDFNFPPSSSARRRSGWPPGSAAPLSCGFSWSTAPIPASCTMATRRRGTRRHRLSASPRWRRRH